MLSKCNVESIQVGTHTAKVVTNVRDLGLWVDSNLTFNIHVNKCVTKAHKQLYWINQIRPCLNNDTANTTVHAFVTSSLDYCNAALYGISKGNMNKLQQVQNYAARVVSNTRKYDHISPVLKVLHWLKIEQRIIFKIALLVFKCLNNMAPPYLVELIHPRISSRQGLHSSYSENKLHEPKTTRKTFADRTFSVAGPRIWNSHTCEIRDTKSIDTFKCKLIYLPNATLKVEDFLKLFF